MSEPMSQRECANFVNRDTEEEIHFVLCLSLIRLHANEIFKYTSVESPSLSHKFMEIMSNANINWSINVTFDFSQKGTQTVDT